MPQELCLRLALPAVRVAQYVIVLGDRAQYVGYNGSDLACSGLARCSSRSASLFHSLIAAFMFSFPEVHPGRRTSLWRALWTLVLPAPL